MFDRNMKNVCSIGNSQQFLVFTFLRDAQRIYRRVKFARLIGLVLLMSTAWTLHPSISGAQTVTDDRGKLHAFATTPKRVVSLSPVSTELLFAVGAGSLLVGRTAHCDYPKSALSVPSLGSLFPADYEKILAARPDLVLMSDGNHKTRARLETLGLPVFVIQPRTVEGIGETIRRLGKLTKSSKIADAAARSFEETLEKLTSQTKDRPSVLFEVWSKPLTTSGPTTFLADIIRVSGGVNLVQQGNEEWPRLSPEWAITADPEVILTGKTSARKAWYGQERLAWRQTKAVRNGHVFVVPDEDVFVRPGPRVIHAIQWLKGTLDQVRRKRR